MFRVHLFKQCVLLCLVPTVAGLLVTDLLAQQPETAKSVPNQTVSSSVSIDRLRSHVSFLSSDELGGRETGSDGLNVAARYIETRFRSWGLSSIMEQPNRNSYFQPVPLRSFKPKGTISISTADRTSPVSVSARPFVFHGKTRFGSFPSRPLVFVGYGISDSKRNYNDYRDVNVKGKYVILFRHEPNQSDPDSKFNGTDWTSGAYFRKKYRTAKEHGAEGLILINDPKGDHAPPRNAGGRQIRLTDAGNTASNDDRIPFLFVSTETGARLMGLSGAALLRLQKKIDRTLTPYSFSLDRRASISVEKTEVRSLSTKNVIGRIEGTDPKLKREHILLGAHYDGSGRKQKGSDRVRNSADDNASGTAAVLELAKIFSSPDNRPRRSLLFVLFTGEEQGLFGSKFYADHPVVPLDQTVAMLNFDMIGRSSEGSVSVFGAGRSPILQRLVTYYGDQTQLNVRVRGKAKKAASDHRAFARRQVPHLFYFTGLHEDYHSAEDEWHRIKYRPMSKIVQHAFFVTRGLASIDQTPTLNESGK